MPPKPTPLFCLESDKEADKAIQEAEDAKTQLECLKTGLVEFNQEVEVARAAKAKWQWLAKEQAKKDQYMEAEEKPMREQQEQLAELAWINQEICLSMLEFGF